MLALCCCPLYFGAVFLDIVDIIVVVGSITRLVRSRQSVIFCIYRGCVFHSILLIYCTCRPHNVRAISAHSQRLRLNRLQLFCVHSNRARQALTRQHTLSGDIENTACSERRRGRRLLLLFNENGRVRHGRNSSRGGALHDEIKQIPHHRRRRHQPCGVGRTSRGKSCLPSTSFLIKNTHTFHG